MHPSTPSLTHAGLPPPAHQSTPQSVLPPIPQSIPMIRANLLEPILDALRSHGHDPSPLLRRQSLPQTTVDPYHLIPLASYVGLFEAAAQQLGDPFLGLRLGQAFRPEHLGPLGFLFRASATLRQALQQLSAYVSVWQSATRMELVLHTDTGADTASFIYQIGDNTLRPRRQDAEYSLAALCALIRNFFGDQWSPLEVHFEHAAYEASSNARRAYSQVFQAPLFFSQNINRVVLRDADLDRPGHASDRSMMPFMQRHLHDLARETTPSETFACQVNYIIARRLGAGSLTLPAVAQELGLSARSFQRRLSEEQTTFRDLVRSQRRTLAESLMKDRTATITSVAHTVGYSETAVLSRAFKLWTGASPRTYVRATRAAN